MSKKEQGKTVQQESEELLQYLKKEETQATIAKLVKQFESIFGLEWFTLVDLSKVFRTSKVEQLVDIIRTLDLCGMIIVNRSKEIERYRISANALKKVDNGVIIME